MVIDKKLNLDKELEYFPDGGLAFAQNIVVSDDGLTIQNEPAIVNFLNDENFDLVGFVACNEEFVLFSSESQIVRIKKDGTRLTCNTNWEWQGGEVFGTFSYNVADELIIAICERNLAPDVYCPLKVINLDREDYIAGANDNIYTLTPEIPKSNMTDVEYVLGNRIKKGKYNFFIKYYIGDNFETAWFPIGIPVFAYDNISASEIKTIDKETIQATNELNEVGLPTKMYNYNIIYEDFYNDDDDYTNNNIKLTFEINDKLNYTHYRIGYIVNTNTGVEGRQIAKQSISNPNNVFKVLIGDYSEPISVDELTIGAFNIYNVKTMCNYKDRLYLANYKEENRNKDVEQIDTSGITVSYNKNDIDIPSITESSSDNLDNYDSLKNQWRSKPGRCAVYNFYIHYVYPNGNYTDGIKIGSIDSYKRILDIGTLVIDDDLNNIHDTKKIPINISSTTTTNDILDKMTENENYYSWQVGYTFTRDANLNDFCNAHLGQLWYVIENEWIGEVSIIAEEENPSGVLTPLDIYTNSKGDILFKTPDNLPLNTRKLWFTGIKMYPQFVGYFISYEKPEYIQIGEGLLVPVNIDRSATGGEADIFMSKAAHSSASWKFYYPEFSIVGGKSTVNKIIHTGDHITGLDQTDVSNNTRNKETKGITLSSSDFNGSGDEYSVKLSTIKSPNGYENIGKEGYLRLDFNENITINQTSNFKTYTAITNANDLYLSDNKKLVSLGFIEYQTYKPDVPNYSFTYGYKNVPYNYDFYRCFNSIIFFRNTGVIINQTESNHINVITGKEFYPATKPDSPFYPHIGIIKYWHETHYPLFLKELNQAPETIFYSYYKYQGDITSSDGEESETTATYKDANQYQRKSLVLNPQYVNDLYKLDPIYYDYTGKIFVNYDKRLISNQLETYNKTIRRSDIIQSESVVNSWKFFRPENYKIITEDKGAINNIVGIGNYLFAHCEHSLFLFDITDSLQALDKNVQLLQPDTFEVAYKEVFTADKGYGGIQDHESWICDEFGYIFFDKSAKKIYRFDGGQLKDMTEGIVEFIKIVNPEHIWFGNDRTRNRIMTNIQSADNSVIFSYNLLSNSWSSTHSYISNYKFIGLKDKLFIPNINGSNLTITHYIDTEFNKFSLPVGDIDNDGSFKSFIDVVFVNPNYNKIKVLDFVTYVLNKKLDSCFELLTMEIYTNCCYSGILDISEERTSVKEYKKPYYDYGRWNFNWFRNIIKHIQNPSLVNRLTGHINHFTCVIDRKIDNALMTGKYVIIRFNFKSTFHKINIKDIQAYFKP